MNVPKFKVGDKVVIINDFPIESLRGIRSEICEVILRDTFDTQYMYLLKIDEYSDKYSKYYLHNHLEFDTQIIREEKINIILDGIS